jgi:hypothetical protein
MKSYILMTHHFVSYTRISFQEEIKNSLNIKIIVALGKVQHMKILTIVKFQIKTLVRPN